MALVPTRAWPLVTAGSSGFISSTNTSSPAPVGSALTAIVAVRPTNTADPTPAIVLTDSHGGTWELSELGGVEGTSTRLAVAVRTTPADGVTSVTATVAGTSQIHLHVFEFAGAPSSLTIADSVADVHVDATVYAPLEVTAPANSLVIGAGSSGVTNRTILLQGSDYVEIGNHKASGVHSASAYRVVGASAVTTGPAWALAEGNSSMSLVQVTAVITEGDGPSALTVDVGADRTTNVDTPIQLTASVSGGSGARTFSWTVESGPSGGGTFVDPSVQNPTFDPGSAPGTYVLQCAVTDSTGTATDSLTLTVLHTTTLLPLAEITQTAGWTVTGAANALAALSDSDDNTFITSSDNPTDLVLGAKLPALMTPGQPLVVRLRGGAPNSSSASVVGRLYVGASLKATSSSVSISPVTGEINVSFPLASLSDITAQDWQDGVDLTLSFSAA